MNDLESCLCHSLQQTQGPVETVKAFLVSMSPQSAHLRRPQFRKFRQRRRPSTAAVKPGETSDFHFHVEGYRSKQAWIMVRASDGTGHWNSERSLAAHCRAVGETGLEFGPCACVRPKKWTL